MRTVAVLALTAALGVGAMLVRVDYGPGRYLEQVAATGVPVVLQLEGACLVDVDGPALARLEYADWRCTVLDRDTRGELYVYAGSDQGFGFDRAGVAALGEVLTEDENGVVLSTDEAGVAALPGLGCELARITLRPLVIQPGSPRPEPAVLPDSLVWQLVDRVSADTLEARLRRLIGFFTRYTTQDSCRSAVAWLGQRLAEYNCDTVIFDDYQSGYAANVIGIKYGTLNPRRIYVVCGHIDDCSELSPAGRAPGSDDNASGTGCVLECARVTAD
ncbi:M28 family peptidase, partial [candidate division WOR-3 bacterium]|nr:M28 family peptidase [candidate division WOR-3 bacterium]